MLNIRCAVYSASTTASGRGSNASACSHNALLPCHCDYCTQLKLFFKSIFSLLKHYSSTPLLHIMADKEATIYIVDMGKSTAQKRGGRTQSDLDWAMLYVWDKITTIMSWERKTALQGVIGLRTNESDNELGEEEDFDHISVLQELDQIMLPDLKRLQGTIIPSQTDRGDTISALVVAIEMIGKKCKQLKYRRKIILVTNGCGKCDDHQLEEIVKKLKQDTIELVILGVDFDDPEYGFAEINKSAEKTKNEALLKSLAEDAGGSFGTLVEAIEELSKPRMKNTRPVPSFKGQLMLGHPADKGNNTLYIEVERYPKTMIRKPATATTVVKRPEQSSSMQSSSMKIDDFQVDQPVSSMGGDDVTRVRDSRAYHVLDNREPGGKKFIEQEDIVSGFEYGSTLVPISQSNRESLKLETTAGLELIGFIPWDKVCALQPMTTY